MYTLSHLLVVAGYEQFMHATWTVISLFSATSSGMDIKDCPTALDNWK